MSWSDCHNEIGISRKTKQKTLRYLDAVKKRIKKLYIMLDRTNDTYTRVRIGKEIKDLKNRRNKLAQRREKEGE